MEYEYEKKIPTAQEMSTMTSLKPFFWMALVGTRQPGAGNGKGVSGLISDT